jgi:hypothetical protein
MTNAMEKRSEDNLVRGKGWKSGDGWVVEVLDGEFRTVRQVQVPGMLSFMRSSVATV